MSSILLKKHNSVISIYFFDIIFETTHNFFWSHELTNFTNLRVDKLS